jgi:hypothetical protein
MVLVLTIALKRAIFQNPLFSTPVHQNRAQALSPFLRPEDLSANITQISNNPAKLRFHCGAAGGTNHLGCDPVLIGE